MSDKSVLCPECGRFYTACTCDPQYEPPGAYIHSYEQPLDEAIDEVVQKTIIQQRAKLAVVQRLLGFALFNNSKGKPEAVDTLLRKAYKELTGKDWDE